MYKHIIFDFGGVVMNFGPDAGEGKKTTGVPSDLSRFFDIPIETAETIWNQHKIGVIKGLETPLQFLEKIQVLLGAKVDPQTILSTWQQSYALKPDNINWDVVALIKLLKQHYRVHLLSDAINLNRDSQAWLVELDQLLFEQIYRSYDHHIKKPEAEAYQYVLGHIPAKPSECVFIDDVEVNVDGGNAVGITSLLYTGSEKLRQDLEGLGVKVE